MSSFKRLDHKVHLNVQQIKFSALFWRWW